MTLPSLWSIDHYEQPTAQTLAARERAADERSIADVSMAHRSPSAPSAWWRALCIVLGSSALGCARAPADWVRDLDDPDPFVRRIGAVALGETADADAALAVPALVRHLTDNDRAVYEAVLHALSTTAPRALPALFASLDLQAVTDPARAKEVRELLHEQRARILAAMPRAMQSAPADRARALELWLSPLRSEDVPGIVPWFSNADPRVRASAARLCGTLHQNSELALDLLSRALDDSAPEVRCTAAENLCEFDVGGARAMRALAAARVNADPVVARTVFVAYAAGQLGLVREQAPGTAAGARAELARLCRDDRALLIADLEHARPRIRRLALHVVMAFVGAHESKAAGGDPELPATAAIRGVCASPTDAELVGLTTALSDPDPDARAQAAFGCCLVLRTLPPASAEAIEPALIALVDDTPPRVRICAALALAELESRAIAARPALDRMHGEDSALLRRVAEYALRALAVD